MLKNLGIIFIKIVSIIPFFKSGLKVFYIYGLSRLKTYQEHYPHLLDIIITSDTKSKDFNYGQSDLNLLIVVDDGARPKQLLKSIRKRIRSNVITNLVFHTQYIPIITKKESRSSALKAFLTRRDLKSSPPWYSLFNQPALKFEANKQSQYSSLFTAYQNLNYHLFRNLSGSTIRSKIKNIYRALLILSRHHAENISFKASYNKLALLLINYPFLSKVLFGRFLKESWLSLNFHKNQLVKEQKSLSLPSELMAHLKNLLKFDFIEDITLTPSVIQHDSQKIKGKLFIEIHANELVTKYKYLKQLENLEEGILKIRAPGLKFRVKVLTQNTLKMQMENFYFNFPMETFYRQQEMVSLKNFSYGAETKQELFYLSAVQFYIAQFFRFRSLEQKTSLIGSKFIKSLNIMFRYYQLAHYLKHKEFLNLREEEKIREVLTPQFSEIEISDIVTDEHWGLIQSQLMYLLKQIKNELVKHDKSLKDLQL